MRKAYPVVLSPSKVGYVATIPDIDRGTQGSSIAEAMEMARDLLGMWATYEQDKGRVVPEPSATLPVAAPGEIVTLVDIDFDEYRREVDTTAERTNVSLPRNLKRKAEAAGLSFSQELQTRLREVLNIS